MADSSKVMNIAGSFIRIILTLVFFFMFKMFLNIQNDIVLAFSALLCSFIVYRGSMFIVKKWVVKESP